MITKDICFRDISFKDISFKGVSKDIYLKDVSLIDISPHGVARLPTVFAQDGLPRALQRSLKEAEPPVLDSRE